MNILRVPTMVLPAVPVVNNDVNVLFPVGFDGIATLVTTLYVPSVQIDI